MSLITEIRDWDKSPAGLAKIEKLITGHNRNQIFNPSNRYRPIHLAIHLGHIEIVKLLLDKGASIHFETTSSGTALHMAVDKHDLAMTKLLLKHGANIHLRSGHEQRTPLELAAVNGNTLIVSLLLEKDSEVIKSDYGFAVLHQVIKSDINLLEQRVEVVKLLLSMGANPDALDEHGNTPLLTAVEHNRPSFIKVLADEHANLDFIGKDGNTPLHKAIIKGNKQLVKSILDAGANLEGLAYNGFTPLIRAVKLHQEPIARLLLKKGALPEAMGSVCYTPLAVATGIGDKPLVKLLLQYNANIEALSQSNLTPLCIAVQKNNISLVRYLIKKDASIKPLTVTLSWCTRYAKALATEHPNSIANMDLFIQNALQSGSTKKAISISPHDIAVILGHTELIKLFRAPELLLQPWNYSHTAVSTLAGAEELHTLFKAIADWDKSDQQYDRIKAMLQTKSNLANMSGSHILFKTTSHGRVITNLTPLYLATQRNHARLVNLLLKLKANPNVFVADRSPLEEAISKDNKEIVNLLLQNGASINMVTTPLIHASDKGSLPVIKLLVKKGANIHSVTGNGRTALLNAIQTGNLTIVRFLLEHGAMDNTALHEAIIWNKPYLVDLLLEYNAPVNAVDADGRTPLFLAVSEKKIKMAQALLSRGATLLPITKSATKLEALFIHSQSWVKKRVMEFINNAIQKGANRESISMYPVDFTLIMSDQEIINLLPQYHFGPTKSEVKSHNGTGSSSSTCLEIHEPDALQSTELYVSDDEIPVANNIPAASSSYPRATSPEAFNIAGSFWNDGFFTPQSPHSNQVKEPSQEILLTICDDDEPTIELLTSDDDNVIEVFTDQTANEEYFLMTAPSHHNSPQITSDSLSVSTPLPQLPEYVESSNSTSSNSSSSTSSEALNLFNPRCSKISQKYMGGVLEYLPSQGGVRSHHVYTYNKTIDLTPLRDLFAPTSKTAIELNTREYSALFYSNQKPVDPSCQHTFIFGARKEKAWIPAVGKKGRCILVLSKEEYAAIGASLPDHIDALVLTRLQSETHGDFNDNLSLLTPRRLVVFLFAHQMKLPHFIMMDDNITKLRVNEEETGTVIPDFSSLYTQLQSKLDISPCISLTTESNYEIPLGKLGSKMFLMDMQAIRKKMYDPSYLFYLFPHSGEIKHCAEDYFFQLFLHHMQADKLNTPGYHILPKEEGVLLRDQSKRTKNSCVQASIQAKEFSIPEHYSTSSTTPDFLSQCLNSTIEDMNFIIQNNFKIYNQKKELLKNVPIYSRHASARKLISADQEFKACEPAQRNQPFVEAFKSKIAHCDLPEQLYNYQTEAIRSVASLPDDIHSGEFAMATGSGKSVLKFTLAAQAFDLLEDKECIAIVAPHIKDVAQLWNSCIEYHRLFNEQSFSERHMLTVSSESTALGLGLLNIIDELQRERNIFIFCAKSFEQFCTDDKYKSLLERVRMVLLDESHVNDELAKRCLTTFNRDSDTLVFGFSATPGYQLGGLLYSYSFTRGIAEGRLAPIIAEKIGCNYSAQRVQDLISCLPELLQHEVHPEPGAKKLIELKGIIYLPSKKDCDHAEQILKQHNIPCTKIYSRHTDQLSTARQLSRNHVIIACRMLRFSYDDAHIRFTIIAQNLGNNKVPNNQKSLIQMIGRGARIDGDNQKINYVLSFSDNIDNIPQEILKSPLAFKPDISFINERNTYKVSGRSVTRGEASRYDQLEPGVTFQITPKPVYERYTNKPNNRLGITYSNTPPISSSETVIATAASTFTSSSSISPSAGRAGFFTSPRTSTKREREEHKVLPTETFSEDKRQRLMSFLSAPLPSSESSFHPHMSG